MRKACKDCGREATYIPRRVTLCHPCKAKRQRDYNRKTGYLKKRYARIAPAERERHLVRKYGVTQAKGSAEGTPSRPVGVPGYLLPVTQLPRPVLLQLPELPTTPDAEPMLQPRGVNPITAS